MNIKSMLVRGSTWGLLSFVACSSPKPVVDPPIELDAGVCGPADSCACACSVLTVLGCPEGALHCVEVCNHAADTATFDMKPACISAATTKEAVRACGTVKCEVGAP
jgi:hypothetical protein